MKFNINRLYQYLVIMTISPVAQPVIPARFRNPRSKRICLLDLTQSVSIIFTIQIAEAIEFLLT